MKNTLIKMILVSLLFSVTTTSMASSKNSKKVSHQLIKPIKLKAKHPHKIAKSSKSNSNIGIASFYGYESGPITASGERFNPRKLTAAHRTLAFGTKLKVKNLKNNKSVVVTVNDRGPTIKSRIIDLSMAAAKAIDMKGIQKVSLSIM